MTKSPDPFDPVEEEEVSRMVSEGGPDTNPPTDTTALNETVREVMESFEWLSKGGVAQKVVVETNGNHSSAKWVKPNKYWKTSTPLTRVKK